MPPEAPKSPTSKLSPETSSRRKLVTVLLLSGGLLIVLFIGLAMLYHFFSNDISLEQYEDDALNFRLLAPEDWEQETIEEGNVEEIMLGPADFGGETRFTKPEEEVSNTLRSEIHSSMTVYRQNRAASPLSQPEYFDKIESSFETRRFQNTYDVMESGRVTINDYEAHKLVRSRTVEQDTDEITTYSHIFYLYVDEETQFTITFFGTESAPIFDAIEDITSSFEAI